MISGILPSFLKIFIYKMMGAEIGKGVRIGFGSVVIGEKIKIGEFSKISMFTYIRGREIKIGRYVSIGSQTVIDTEKIEIDDDAKITEQVFIGGLSSPDSLLKMGKRTTIMKMSFINTTKPVVIGDDTGVGGHCLLFTHGSWQNKLEGYPVAFAPISLGKNVWLPWRIFIMPGVSIGDGCTIGADSLVTKDIPAGSLAAGSPAKVIKTAEEYPKKLTFEEKNNTMVNILEEFIAYLSYNGLNIDSEKKKESYCSKILTGNSEYRLNYYNSELMEENLKNLNKNTFLLSLKNIPKDLRIKMTQSSIMWADLYSKERNGTNNIGEETLKYLSRYGIRFDRTD
ncbi:MAG TPA: acyltransferase [Ignavibacteria bacterium]|nr:acyltransferase [Ignavibacteria bacterium]